MLWYLNKRNPNKHKRDKIRKNKTKTKQSKQIYKDTKTRLNRGQTCDKTKEKQIEYELGFLGKSMRAYT